MKGLAGLVLTVSMLLPVGPSVQAQTDVGAETEWTFAAVGNVIMTRRLVQYDHEGDPGFHDLANLNREADAPFMNLETSLFTHAEFDGWPAAENGRKYLCAVTKYWPDDDRACATEARRMRVTCH